MDNLKLENLSAGEKSTYDMFVNVLGMTEAQALAAIAAQRAAVADATAKKTTAKKVPEFAAPVYALLKSCFKAEYKATKTDLELRIADLQTRIPAQQEYIAALNATNDKLREKSKGEKLTDKQKAKLADEMNKNSAEIEQYQKNLETFNSAIETANAELETAEDKWTVSMPDFGDKPSYADVLAYFEHKETTQRANSGRTDNGKASKGQTLPKYNLNMAADITAKVCQFLNVEVPAPVATDTPVAPVAPEKVEGAN